MTATDPLGFLGEEFLTWLWYRLETEGGDFSLGKGRDIGVSFDDYIVFSACDEDETEQILRGGTPSRTQEAATSLRNGRRLSRARLVIALGEQEWSLVLEGTTMNLLTVKLPPDAESETADARSVERAQAFLTLHELVSGLYGVFLEERLSPGYLGGGAESQATWMATR